MYYIAYPGRVDGIVGSHRQQTKRYKIKPSARVRDGLVVARIGEIGGIVIPGYGESIV